MSLINNKSNTKEQYLPWASLLDGPKENVVQFSQTGTEQIDAHAAFFLFIFLGQS
jgi:hypothetical protein